MITRQVRIIDSEGKPIVLPMTTFGTSNKDSGMKTYYVRIIDSKNVQDETEVEARDAECAAYYALDEMLSEDPVLAALDEGDELIVAVSESEDFVAEEVKFFKIRTELRPKHYVDELDMEYDDKYTDEAHKLLECR